MTNEKLEKANQIQGELKKKREAVDAIGKILMNMADTEAYRVMIEVKCEYHNSVTTLVNATEFLPHEIKHALEHAQIRLRNEAQDLEKEFQLL